MDQEGQSNSLQDKKKQDEMFPSTNKLVTALVLVITVSFYKKRPSLSVMHYVHLLLMPAEYFLLLQLHIKSISQVKRVDFYYEGS